MMARRLSYFITFYRKVKGSISNFDSMYFDTFLACNINFINWFEDARIHYEGLDNFLADFKVPDNLISNSFHQRSCK